MTASNLSLALAVLSLGLGACEKNDAASTPPTDASPPPASTVVESTPEATAESEPQLAAVLVDFHDVMSPLWHAEAGETRTADTCGAANDLLTGAKAIATAPTPDEAVDDEAWQASAEALLSTTEALRIVCEDGDASTFDTAFAALHTAFHTLVTLTRSEG